MTATLEPGLRGPQAEALLAAHGLTLGHFRTGAARPEFKEDETPVTVAEVPEPGTLALMGTGAIGLGLLPRRKSRNDAGTQARRDPTLNRLRSMTLISRGHR